MAKKKKRGGKRSSEKELAAAVKALKGVEKDVAKVRKNLKTFMLDAEQHLSGGSHHIPPPVHKRRKRTIRG